MDECLTSMPTAKPTKNGRRPPFAYSAETLEVEQITALVGLKRTRFYAKGDVVGARSPQLRRTNAWLLGSGVAEDQGVDGLDLKINLYPPGLIQDGEVLYIAK